MLDLVFQCIHGRAAVTVPRREISDHQLVNHQVFQMLTTTLERLDLQSRVHIDHEAGVLVGRSAVFCAWVSDGARLAVLEFDVILVLVKVLLQFFGLAAVKPAAVFELGLLQLHARFRIPLFCLEGADGFDSLDARQPAASVLRWIQRCVGHKELELGDARVADFRGAELFVHDRLRCRT
jgi:hypothetical protein